MVQCMWPSCGILYYLAFTREGSVWRISSWLALLLKEEIFKDRQSYGEQCYLPLDNTLVLNWAVSG
ncbi:hypothetical protein SAMN05428978_104411 [Nitrosomonas sp. Nm34]|nr:hypothetical protein SAMN05428978_104411 [Nitrosomonas sp. Nm34]